MGYSIYLMNIFHFIYSSILLSTMCQVIRGEYKGHKEHPNLQEFTRKSVPETGNTSIPTKQNNNLVRFPVIML